MTGRWLTPNKAREELGLSWDQLTDLLKSGWLSLVLIGDHYSISEGSVSELTAPRGDVLAVHADKPTVPVGEGPELPAFIEDEHECAKGEE